MKPNDEITISDKSIQDQLIYRVYVDNPHNALLTLEVNSTTNQTALDLFTVNGLTREIKIKNATNLDNNGGKSFELFFYLNSSSLLVGQYPEFKLKINLYAIAEQAPKFVVESFTFNVSESAPAGTVVGRLLITGIDPDRVKYFVQGQEDTATSASPSGDMLLSPAFDDEFSPPMMSDEGPPPTPSLHLSYNPVSSDLTELIDGVFRINKTSGDIIVDGKLDYEGKSEYVTTICARNLDASASDPQAVSCVPVVVKLSNVDDNVPKFNTVNNATFLITISESVPNGLEIFRFSAQDLDNTPVYYRYNSNKTQAGDMNTFSLVNTTGALVVSASKLDFELKSIYYLYVQAIDSSSLTVTDEVKLTVSLLDVNDNNPLFDRSIFEIKVQDNVTVGTIITSLTATDKDALSQGKIKYYILVNQNSDMFLINATNGDVSTSQSLVDVSSQPFPLTVCANDSYIDERHTYQGKII